MGFPFSVPHVAPLDSPIGEWDRRCRVCSDQFEVVNESSFLPVKLVINTTKSFVDWFGSFLEINLIHRTICRFNMNLQPCM